MPKCLALLAAILFILCRIFSKDKNLSAFGKVDKAELELNSCEFDKDAEALILFDVGEFRCDFNGNSVITELVRHVRIKILKDKGRSAADIKIPYNSFKNAEAISNLAASAYNLDVEGNIVASKLEKKLVYDKRKNARISEQIFTLPEVKAGSVIEYKYVLRGADLQDWYFQQGIPVRYSKYQLNFPKEFEVHARPFCSLPFEKKDESNGLREIKTISMKNIPAMRDENYITCQEDYLQKVESRLIAFNTGVRRINLIRTWQEVVDNLMTDEDFGIQLKKDIPRTADLDLELMKVTDSFARMATIHNYVRKNMKWDGYNSIWALDGVKAAWKEKKGNSGEINLILVNLLKDAGFKAYPVLVSTHKNGRVPIGFPDINKFNKVLALVKMSNKIYVMDGTDKYTPSGLIPADVTYTEGLVIEKTTLSAFGWQGLWDATKMERNTVVFQAKINELGEMTGTVSISSKEYARTKRMPVLQDGRDKYIEHFYTANNSGLFIDSSYFKNEETDSLPLVQVLKFHLALAGTGDYRFISTNVFSGLQKQSVPLGQPVLGCIFGSNQHHQLISNIILPENYTLEELPKNMRMMLEDKSLKVTRMTASANNVLTTRTTIEFGRPYYNANEYADLREFYKKMFGLLNEQIVLKKKAS